MRRRRAEERATRQAVSIGMTDKAHDTPSEINAEEGEVLVDGPNGFAYAFTPEAAIETSERLFEGGLTAQGQRFEKRRRSEFDRSTRRGQASHAGPAGRD